MFSVIQKRQISTQIQQILRDTKHPELPEGEIQFSIHVDGRLPYSWADIENNGAEDMAMWVELAFNEYSRAEEQ